MGPDRGQVATGRAGSAAASERQEFHSWASPTHVGDQSDTSLPTPQNQRRLTPATVSQRYRSHYVTRVPGLDRNLRGRTVIGARDRQACSSPR